MKAANEEKLVELGLSMSNLFSTQGQLCAEKFPEIISLLHTIDAGTKCGISDGLNLWGTCSPPALKETVLTEHASSLYNAIQSLALTPESQSSFDGDDYKGDSFCANKIAEMLTTAGMMDQTQTLVSVLAPFAYIAAQGILDSKMKLEVKQPMQRKENANIFRGSTLKALIRTMPYSGTVSIPNGTKVLCTILTDKSIPQPLHQDAQSAFSTMAMVNKQNVVSSGKDIIDVIKSGGHDQMMMLFVSEPSLYTQNRSIVEENISLFTKQSFMMYASLFSNIGQSNPKVLVPYIDFFVKQIAAAPQMGTLVVMILGSIANADPNGIFAILPTIQDKVSSMQSGNLLIAQIWGKVSNATVPDNACDLSFLQLVKLLDSPGSDGTAVGVIMNEISNLKANLSSKEVLIAQLPKIAAHRSSAELAFTAIDDYAAGRSLEILTLRVDELDAKIGAMNVKISQSCSNMADVIAYIDANMADMKDFLADVVKKLPNPKRLEVVGTLRKSLILHFECVRTGYEYPIVSHEWSKWLKIGFSLVKAGQAIIDVGMGNPLGILKKGIDCIQEVYTAYKTNDDDEFNTYITNPFLLSSEQDQLLEKLRDQGFFDIFAYDAQIPGWYLLHPEKDGKPPEGEAGSVSKVWKKEGYGIGETVSTLVKTAITTVTGDDTFVGDMELISDVVSDMKGSGNESTENDEKNSSTVPNKKAGTSGTGSGTGSSGSRALAMKETFGAQTISSANDKLAVTEQTVTYQRKVDDLEAKVAELEKKLELLASNQQPTSSRGRCIIS
eukprot:gene3966-5686_t